MTKYQDQELSPHLLIHSSIHLLIGYTSQING